ncbi:rhodanese-related sulfurtransferase [Candidatus Dojkabacteria bacterium]|uniref:tRNA uridine(34) hydroxylase n=1 Tax=Candidatus Dojkabacteria bacterium TaxID=2099670 RepID=A0A955RK80_9BACT|nr:rhodanese-related sulfurtransferase [Candidatus Dojkabacteria bacterium]
MKKTVLLYYLYTKIEEPEILRDHQRALCKRLGLKGRILISEEGINGTLSGSKEATDEYMKETNEYPGLESIEWKISASDGDVFPKLRVVVRDEVVTLGVKKSGKDVNIDNTAEYIEPEELLNLYENDEDFIIIDARNEYEARIGKFKNAKIFDVKAFREIPELIRNGELDDVKDKQVVTYCTGGIRCEKFSAFLKEEGFKNVRQLHGGIHRYSDLTGGKHFEGEMYVFDGRVHIPVNNVDPSVISECYHCKEKVARFINCHNSKCNKQIICCESCSEKHDNTCSEACQSAIQEHPELRAYKNVEHVQANACSIA